MRSKEGVVVVVVVVVHVVETEHRICYRCGLKMMMMAAKKRRWTSSTSKQHFCLDLFLLVVCLSVCLFVRLFFIIKYTEVTMMITKH